MRQRLLTARYVAMAKPPKLAMTKYAVEGGCWDTLGRRREGCRRQLWVES